MNNFNCHYIIRQQSMVPCELPRINSYLLPPESSLPPSWHERVLWAEMDESEDVWYYVCLGAWDDNMQIYRSMFSMFQFVRVVQKIISIATLVCTNRLCGGIGRRVIRGVGIGVGCLLYSREKAERRHIILAKMYHVDQSHISSNICTHNNVVLSSITYLPGG